MKQIIKLTALLLSSFLMSSSLIACSNNSTNDLNNSQTSNVSTDTQNKKNYKLSEAVMISASYGNYQLTFTDIIESDKRNLYADSQPKRIIIVKYLYENVNCTQDITISHLYFRAYDNNGTLLNIYPSTEVENPNTISAGGKRTASVAYALNNETNYIKLDFYNIDYSDLINSACTFELEW